MMRLPCAFEATKLVETRIAERAKKNISVQIKNFETGFFLTFSEEESELVCVLTTSLEVYFISRHLDHCCSTTVEKNVAL
jgi:hypothetical protein